MRKAYCQTNPPPELIAKCTEIEFNDVAIYCGKKEEFICHASKVPKYSPPNFVLVLPKLTPAVKKELEAKKYMIVHPEFYNKRLLSDQNRQAVFDDMGKLEHLHLYMLAKNFDKAGVNMEILSKVAEFCHEWHIPNEMLKAAIVFSTKATEKIEVMRY